MTRADNVIRFIEAFCKVPEGALVGQPLRLEQFQVDFIKSIYDNPHGTKKAYLSIARKNGKTALIACLVLVHLVGPEAQQNAQILSGATSREQASIVFSLTAKMVRMNPELDDVVRIVDSRKELYGLPMGTEYKAIAAEGKTAHGKSPEFPGIDFVTGGTFEGLPVIVSTNVPGDATAGFDVILAVQSEIFVAEGGLSIDASREASLEMSDAPTNDAKAPTASAMVSLWQTGGVAFKAIRGITWTRRRPTAVYRIGAAKYA